MSSEDQEMMARISQLAGKSRHDQQSTACVEAKLTTDNQGQINRHKNQQAGFTETYPYPTSSQSYPITAEEGKAKEGYTHLIADARGSRRARPYSARNYRGAGASRHRQLVVNHASNTAPASDADSEKSTLTSWITRSDRHLQLINSSVYEKEAQARTQAIEHTRQQKRQARDAREKARLISHIKRTTVMPRAGGAVPEIVIDGVRFHVTKNGSKLTREPGAITIAARTSRRSTDGSTGQSITATPKMATVGGVRFYRSKNNNMYRHGVVKAQRYVSSHSVGSGLISRPLRQSGVVNKIDAPCRAFTSTGITQLHKARSPISRHVWDTVRAAPSQTANSRLGSCSKGPRCRYVHDPTKVAVCKDLLLKGSCPNGADCDLSHDLSPQRVPHCVHFAKGNCSNASCRYTHTLLTPGAPVCRAFGIYGYCDKGAACSERHAFECPDFSNTGVCKTKGCKLLHRERASLLRKQNAQEKEREEGAMDDLSSEEEDDVGDDASNDVDSDEVDEFLGSDAATDLDFAEQREFIAL
jgi:hypothetical protein